MRASRAPDRASLVCWLAVLGLGVLAAQPLLTIGLPYGQDTLYHVQRVASLARALSHGVVFPRWSADLALGFGYPVFHYYAPLSYYVPAFLTLLGLSAVQATTLFAAAIYVLQAVGMWLWLRVHFRSAAAYIGSVAYVLAPYAVANFTWRGALAEHFALALAPLALWSLARLAQTAQPLQFLAAVGVLAALMLSHNVSALMFFGVVVLYVGYLSLVHKRADVVSTALLLAVGVASFFWLPALGERGAAQLNRLHDVGWANFRGYFMTLEEHFAAPEPVDRRLVTQPRDPRLNSAVVAAAATGALLAVVRWVRARDPRAMLVLTAAVGFVGALAMTHRLSLPIWETLDALKFLQFPWRFYTLLTLCLAPMAASAAEMLSALLALRPRVFATVSVAALGFCAAYVFPRQIPTELVSPNLDLSPHSVAHFEHQTTYIGTTTAGEYLPAAVQERPPLHSSPFADPHVPFASAPRLWRELSSTELNVLSEQYAPYRYALRVAAPQTATLVFKTFYFPGWSAYVDGTRASLSVCPPYGVLQVDMPPGDHEVVIAFESTPPRQLAEAFTLVSCALAAGVAFMLHRRKHPAQLVARQEHDAFESLWGVLMLTAGVLFAVKTLWVDRAETPFAYTRFDGVNVRGVDIPLQKTFEGGLVLIGAEVPQRIGTHFSARLYWRLAQPISRELSTSLQVLDEQGFIVGQSDNQHPSDYPVPKWMLDRYARDVHEVRIFPGTPPGTYTLYARVYPYGQPDAPLSVLSDLGSPEGAAVEVTRVYLPPLRWNDAPGVLAAEHYLGPSASQASISLVAYNQPLGQARPGDALPLTFFWRVQASPNQAITATLAFVDTQGNRATSVAFPPVAQHPTSVWQRGEVWRGNHRLRVPRRLSSGVYRLVLSYADVSLVLNEPLIVVAPLRRFVPLDLGTPLQQSFADAGMLVAFDAPKRAAPRETIPIRLVWRATRETEQAYKVFVHLLDERGAYVAGHDSEPANWERPTTSWISGEYVLDEHLIVLPERSPARYTVRTGLYDPVTGARVRTESGDDGVTLPISILVASQ
ncbi:MAG: 6-pyruvoyl-tetrahydropterin synthase-related protein [Anaerolineae bacterium]|nr:6-pyruvoyl-tetrahydropterin synthase-related protein [Anaerolineae bacterium]